MVWSGAIELISVVICIFAAAGGHGTYLPCKLLFPTTMISTGSLQQITPPFIIFALLQFPVYGFLLVILGKRWGPKWPLMILGIGHTVLAGLALGMSSSYFPN